MRTFAGSDGSMQRVSAPAVVDAGSPPLADMAFNHPRPVRPDRLLGRRSCSRLRRGLRYLIRLRFLGALAGRYWR